MRDRFLIGQEYEIRVMPIGSCIRMFSTIGFLIGRYFLIGSRVGALQLQDNWIGFGIGSVSASNLLVVGLELGRNSRF